MAFPVHWMLALSQNGDVTWHIQKLLLPGTKCACCCMKCHVPCHSLLLAKREAAAGSQLAHDQIRLLQTHVAIAGQHQCILLLNSPMQPG